VKQTNRHTIQVEYPTELSRPQEFADDFEAISDKGPEVVPDAYSIMPSTNPLPQKSHARLVEDEIHQIEREEREDRASKATGSAEDSSAEAMSPSNLGGGTLSAAPFDSPDMASANATSKASVERTHATGRIDLLTKSPAQPELGARRDDQSIVVNHQVLRPIVAGQTSANTEFKDESAMRADLTLSSDPISSRYVIRFSSIT